MGVLATERPQDAPAYTAFHRWLHWLIAAGVAALFATAFSMEGAEGATRNRIYIAHWSFGFLVACLMLVRVVSRLASPPKPLRAPLSAPQKWAAHTVHVLLYVTLIVQPILGYAAKSMFGGSIPIFGLFDLPDVFPQNQDLAEQLFAVHEVVGIAILLLVAIHVSAAMYHVFRGDNVMSRMTTG